MTQVGVTVFQEIIENKIAQIILNLYSFTMYFWYSNHIYQEGQLL